MPIRSRSSARTSRTARVVIRAYQPSAERVDVVRDGRVTPMTRVTPAASSRRSSRTPATIFDYRLRVTYPGGHVADDRRSVSLRPGHHRVRPLPLLAGQAHAHLRQARRAPDADRRGRRRALRRLGAQRRPRQRRRRLQRVGRPRPPDAPARADRRLGDLHPRPRRGRALQVRDPVEPARRAAAEGRSVRLRVRAAAADRVDRRAASTTPGRTRSGSIDRAGVNAWLDRPMAIYEVHLGSWVRVPGRARSLPDLPRARRRGSFPT